MKSLEKRFKEIYDKTTEPTVVHLVDTTGNAYDVCIIKKVNEDVFFEELLKAVEDYGEEVKAKTELDYVKVYYPKEVPMEVRNPIFMYLDKFLSNLREK